jgi:hypothetical protein
MIVVIQCAGSKQPHAGCLKTRGGKLVLFVGDPAEAPPERGTVYARPDDISDTGRSWRENLLKYSANPGSNPLGLLPAHELYQNPAYSTLVEHCGLDKTFILSAGWGLIPASFFTPNYDITFSASAEAYQRRKRADFYGDFCMLSEIANEDVYFFGGKDYVPLFCKLTSGYRGKRIVFYNSAVQPFAPGCALRRFETTTRTNWHYECANAFVSAASRNGVGTEVSAPSHKSNPRDHDARQHQQKSKQGEWRMNDAETRGAIRRARKGITQYLWLMRSLHTVDVSANGEFQKRYNSFYRVRQRSAEWYAAYYDLLETCKKAGIGFDDVLYTLWQRLGRYEPSFSSKLAATIDPTTPIWDRFVLLNTGQSAPLYTDPQRRSKANVVYRQICEWYSTNLASADGRRIIEIFEEEIPECAEITDLKKFDFVLWQTRPKD